MRHLLRQLIDPRGLAYVMLAVVAIGLAGFAYTEPRRVQNEAEHHTDQRFAELLRRQQEQSRQLVIVFCGYMRTQANPDPPPTTDRGRVQQRAAADLVDLLRCPK